MKEKLTKCILVYYFILINIYKISNINPKIIYIALVAPLVLVSLYTVKYLVNIKQLKMTLLLFIHFVIMSVISIARFDINTILNVAQIFVIIYFLLNKPVGINIEFLNKLFLIAIFLGFIGNIIGTNIYGITFLNLGAERSRLWRVSLFLSDNLPVSATFATLILIINNFHNTKRRYLFSLLSLYFIILSGSKTSIVILGVTMLSILISKKKITLVSKFILILLPFISIALVFNIGELINSFSYYIAVNYKKIAAWLNIGSLTYDIFSGRNIIWDYHLSIFKENWLFGAGDFTLSDFAQDITIGSESKFSFILARDGIFSFLFFGQFIYWVYYTVKENLTLAYIIVSALMIIMFFYGSFSQGYNFGFIVYFAVFASELKAKVKEKKEVDCFVLGELNE